jgi:hypothetical protein
VDADEEAGATDIVGAATNTNTNVDNADFNDTTHLDV